MPELPEVETVRRQLAPALEGRSLHRLEVLDPRWCDPAPPSELAAATEGRTVEAVTRRGKYLTLELSDEVYVVMHLRMTGNLLLVGRGEDDPARRHLRVRFDGRRASGCCSSTSAGSAPGGAARRRRAGLALRLGMGVEPFSPADFTRRCAASPWPRAAAHRSRPSCSTRRGWRGWGDIMPTRRSTAPTSTLVPVGSAAPVTGRGPARCGGRLAGGGRRDAARGDHQRFSPLRRGPRLVPGPLHGPPARGRALRALRDHDPQAPRGRAGARTCVGARAPRGPARRRLRPAPLGGQQVAQHAVAVGLDQLAEAADRALADQHLGNVIWPVMATRSARPTGPWPG